MPQLQRRAVLLVVVSLHLMFDAAVIPAADSLGDSRAYVSVVLVGIVWGQFGMLAAYFAWGSEHGIVRLCTSCFAVILLWYALAAGAASTGNSFSVSSIERLLGMLTFGLFACVSLLYWAIRTLFRRRISPIQCGTQSVISPRLQISIRRLLVWIVAAAVALRIGQSAVGGELWSGWSMNARDLVGFLLVMALTALLLALLAVPATWASLCTRNPLRPLIIVGVYATIVVAIQCAVVFAIEDDDRWVVLAAVNLAMFVHVVACSLLLRICGYRLVRTHGGGAGSTATQT